MNEDNNLKRGLKNRHIQMIALGGAIGTGLFYGSATTIQLVGPGVILSYIIGGFFIFLIMRAMGEMSVHNPVSGSFSTYAYNYLGNFPGFFSGWNYWFCYIAVSMAEISVVGIYMNYWFPDLPTWCSALMFFLLITLINLCNVKVYGEVEFWGAIIKVVAVILMILFGLAIIFFGIGNGGNSIGFENLYKDGGFLPNGIKGLLLSLCVVAFSFGGLELIGITAGEAENPEKSIPKAINQVVFRILVFYVGAMFVLVTLFPWDKVGMEGSPFVEIFAKLGIPAAATILNVVVLTAAVSAYNSCLYSNARVLYGLAQQGNAPKFLLRTASNGAPVRCVLLSSSFVAIGVILNYIFPGKMFMYVMSIATLAIIMNWFLILLTQQKFRKTIGQEASEKLLFKMPFYPYSNYITLVYLVMIAVLMAYIPDMRISLFLAPVWITIIFIGYQIKKRAR